ncbi:MAG: acyltransferase [Ferruginibacter sp.]
MNAKRQGWIDYARGIAIILVLYRHVFEGIKQAGVPVTRYLSVEYANIMFYSFRMPLFFIVSGFFVASSLKKRGVQEFVATKARTILYPYFLWGGLQITLQLIFSGYVNANREQMDYALLFYSPRQVGQFWYLYALFSVAVLYALGKVLLKIPVWLNLLIGLIMFYTSSFLFRNDINVWFLSDILHYYVFFAVGDLAGGFMTNADSKRFLESNKILLLMLLPFVGLQGWYLYENLKNPSEHYDYVEYHLPLVFLLISLVGCAFIILLSHLLQRKQIASWVRVLGEHSLYIYVAHVMVMAGVRIFMMHVLHINHLPTLLLTGIASGLIVPVLLYKLSKKLNMEWLFSLKLHRNSIAKAREI